MENGVISEPLKQRIKQLAIETPSVLECDYYSIVDEPPRKGKAVRSVMFEPELEAQWKGLTKQERYRQRTREIKRRALLDSGMVPRGAGKPRKTG